MNERLEKWATTEVPPWKFWDLRSGLIGGLLAGVLLSGVVVLCLYYFG